MADFPSNRTNALRRWVERHATRDNLADVLKKLAWVVPLTVLIWVYADQEQTDTQRDLAILLDITCAEPRRIVTVLSPSGDVPTVELRGPRSRLEYVRSQLSKSGETRLVQV